MKWKFLSPWKAFDVLTDLEFFKSQVNVLSSKNQELQDINQHINRELKAYRDAENKGCKIGDYCKNCAFGRKRRDYIRFDVSNAPSIIDCYVCEFDCCKHFERKEKVVL